MADGTKFGRYQLLQRLAVGGMAEIFLAKQHGPGHFERSLVIKRILPHLAQDPKFVEMFLDEAAVAVQLNHPNIAQVYDFGHEEESYYIAMELIRGPDLANLLAACRHVASAPPVEVSIRIITQVASALDYAHHAVDDHGRPLGLVHRDVSPQNVLVSYDGVVKLVDFGIAKAAGASHQTEAGLVKGKFSYMAPEQLRGDKLDGRCDEYAAGLLLYELLTLTQGLPGDGPSAIAAALSARIEPIVNLRADIPAELAAIVNHVLRADREERYANCADFQEALDAWLVQRAISVRPHEVSVFLADLQQRFGAPLSPVLSTTGKPTPGPGVPSARPLPLAPTPTSTPFSTEFEPELTKNDKDTAISPTAGTVLAPTATPSSSHPKSASHGVLWALAGAAGVFSLAAAAWFVVDGREAQPLAQLFTQPIAAKPPDPTPTAKATPTAIPAVASTPTSAPVPHPTRSPARSPEVAQPAPDPRPPSPKPVHRKPAPTPPATLSISSRPKAEAFLDGNDLGRTPIDAMTVAAGPHILRLASADPLISHEARLSLAPGEMHREDFNLKMGQVQFRTRPWSNITFAGRALGQTPVPPHRVEEGTYDVVVEFPDLHKTVRRKVKVEAHELTTFKLILPGE